MLLYFCNFYSSPIFEKQKPKQK